MATAQSAVKSLRLVLKYVQSVKRNLMIPSRNPDLDYLRMERMGILLDDEREPTDAEIQVVEMDIKLMLSAELTDAAPKTPVSGETQSRHSVQ